MPQLFDRVKMSVASTGTGAVTLGSALPGFKSFESAGVADGSTVYYVIEDGTSWEVGVGTYTASSTSLSRAVRDSSNGGSAINLTSSATIFITILAEELNDLLTNLNTLSPLNIEDFGADESVTDNGPAIVAALEFAAGRPVKFPSGKTYPVTSSVNYIGPVDLDFADSEVLVNANVMAFRLSAPIAGPYALTADYVVGSTTLTVSTLPSAPVAGQVIHVYSDARDPANRDNGSSSSQYRLRESVLVGEGSTTTSIVLARPLRFVEGVASASGVGDEARVPTYTTANNAGILIPDQSTKCNIKLGRIRYQEGQEATWSAAAVRLRGYVKPRVIGGEILRGYGPGVDLVGTYGAVVDGLNVGHLENNTSNGQYGYGVADSGDYTRVYNLTGANYRHLYTTNSATRTTSPSDPVYGRLASGRAVGGVVYNLHGEASNNAAVDTHHDATDTTFSGGAVTGSVGWAAAVRGRNIVIKDLIVRDGQAGGIYTFTEYDSGDPDDDFYTNGKLTEDFTSAVWSSNDMECASYPFESSHATVRTIGHNVGRSSGEYVGLLCDGGTIAVDGPMTLTTAGAGADNGLGLLTIRPANAAAATAFPTPRVEINAPVKIDGRSATPVLLHGIYVDTGCELVIRDTLHLILPAGATAWNSGATIRCEGRGEILIEVIGADDSTVATAAAFGTLPVRVRTSDGTARFDGVRGSERVLWTLPTQITHAGTGAESTILLDSGGQAFCAGAVTSGEIEKWTLRLRGRRTGSVAGTTQLRVRLGGSTYVLDLDIFDPTATGSGGWEAEITAGIYAAGEVYYTANAQYTNGPGFAQSLETGLSTPTRLIRIFAIVPSGDTLIITGAELLGERG